MGSEVRDDDRAVARMLAGAFGGKASVRRHWDEPERSHVDILTCRDTPQAGVSCHATVTLANHPILRDGKEFPARAEILGACASETGAFAQALATCAFAVINHGWLLAPGIVFPGVLSMHGLSTTLSHVMFTPPTLWGDRIDTMELGSRTIAFLMAAPISEGEYAFAQEKGGDALEDLFVARQIDLFDIHRPSVA